MKSFLYLFILGGTGTLARYAISQSSQIFFKTTFPIGTFVVNILGCFAFGMIWIMAEQRNWISADLKLWILTGFMGAFTTFSTFAFDSALMLREGQWGLLLLNILAQNILGIGAVFAGMKLSQIF